METVQVAAAMLLLALICVFATEWLFREAELGALTAAITILLVNMFAAEKIVELSKQFLGWVAVGIYTAAVVAIFLFPWAIEKRRRHGCEGPK